MWKFSVLRVVLLTSLAVLNLNGADMQKEYVEKLGDAPEQIDYFKELAVLPSKSISELYNNLKPEERVFVYYMFRASLPGNRIVADQIHRNCLQALDLFEEIVSKKELLKQADFEQVKLDVDAFLRDLTTYLVYLWTNHGPYFKKEHVNEKRTPSKLGFAVLNEQNLILVLDSLGKQDASSIVKNLSSFIFDKNFEPTNTVPDSIEKSSVNIYSQDFMDSDYEKLSQKERGGLNKYFYIKDEAGNKKPAYILYKVDGKYGKELEVCSYWLDKACKFVQDYPETFDKHLAKSLEYLIEFLKTGDEELFKKYSIEWLQSNSRIDYNFGFIECYSDPKAQRGMFEAEATIKTLDISKLNKVLPGIESQMPLPENYKRKTLSANSSSIPNASINSLIFGTGDLGPMNVVAAYCLPNYGDIRSKYGSKQVIYKPEKGLADIVNPLLYKKLFFLKDRSDWLIENDPDKDLLREIWTLHTILHETIGHGSGSFDKHTFKDGESLVVDDVTYKIGDQIEVTDENVDDFFVGYSNAVEELRAEIIALYIATYNLEKINQAGFLGEWTKKLGKEKVIEWLIWDMANSGLRRLITQDEKATEIAGDHALANSTILNYLVDNRGVKIVEQEVTVDEKTYKVLGCDIVDQQKAIEGIKELMVLVQTIKSTADGVEAKRLIGKYGKKINKPEYIKVLKSNLKAVVGDVKGSAFIYPDFFPVIDKENGKIVDIQAKWPKNIVEQQLLYSKLNYSKDLFNQIFV